jgi:hypothetical protein
MTTDVELELDLARNMFGSLSPAVRTCIRAVVANPTQETWDKAHCKIIGSDRWMTLWQAVLAVDPTFCQSKPSRGPWPRIPTQQTLVKALQFATH